VTTSLWQRACRPMCYKAAPTCAAVQNRISCRDKLNAAVNFTHAQEPARHQTRRLRDPRCMTCNKNWPGKSCSARYRPTIIPNKAAQPQVLDRLPAVDPPEGTRAARPMTPARTSNHAAAGLLPAESLPYSPASSSSASGMCCSSHRRGQRPNGRLGHTAKPCRQVRVSPCACAGVLRPNPAAM